jgi:hypothetical protein
MNQSIEQLAVSVLRDGSAEVSFEFAQSNKMALRDIGIIIRQSDFADFSGYGETNYHAYLASWITRKIWRILA